MPSDGQMKIYICPVRKSGMPFISLVILKKGRDYRFMGMDFVTAHNLKINAEDYRLVYGGKLSEGKTLEGLYERFNINHPAGYEGHSLSVSDVVVLTNGGSAKAYYVDSMGFAELPDFILQRQHEVKMNHKEKIPL